MSCRITPSAKTILKSHHNQANDTLQNKRYDFWKQGAFLFPTYALDMMQLST